MDVSFLNLVPPIITFGESSIDDVARTANSSRVTPQEASFLNTVIQVCKSEGRLFTEGFRVAETLNVSQDTVRRVLLALTKKGLFERIKCTTSKTKGRSAFIYSFLLDASDVAESKQIELLDSPIKSIVLPEEEIYGKLDRLIYSLAPSLEPNHKKSTTKREVMLHIDKQVVKVTTLTRVGSVLAKVRDLRYYIALLRLCAGIMSQRLEQFDKGEIQEREVFSGYFLVNEADLLQVMGSSTGVKSREHMRAGFQRLEDTRYIIESAPSEFLNRFNIVSVKDGIDHFRIARYAKSKDNVVYYLFELSTNQVKLLYDNALYDDELLIEVEHGIYNEKNPITFMLMLFAFTLPASRIVRMSWEALKDKVAPSMSMREFKEKLSVILYKYRVDDGITHFGEDGKIIQEVHAKIGNIEVMLPGDNQFSIQRILNMQKMIVRKKRLRLASNSKSKALK